MIARHPRCWDREDMVFDPVHYLAQEARSCIFGLSLEQKPNKMIVHTRSSYALFKGIFVSSQVYISGCAREK